MKAKKIVCGHRHLCQRAITVIVSETIDLENACIAYSFGGSRPKSGGSITFEPSIEVLNGTGGGHVAEERWLHNEQRIERERDKLAFRPTVPFNSTFSVT